MLLETIQIGLKVLKRNTKLLKITLLLIAPIFLFIKPIEYSIGSEESLIDETAIIEDPGFYDVPVEHKEMPPHETIYVLYNGSSDLERKLAEKINRLIIRSKSIKIRREDTSENVFIKICIKEGPEDKLILHPLRSSQPNSSLLAIANMLFPPTVDISISDIFQYGFENRINLMISPSDDSVNRFCTLLRYYSNIHSHYYGVYYYIPLKRGMITLPMLRWFILCSLAHEAFEFESKINYFELIFQWGFYYLVPPAGFFMLKRQRRVVNLLMFSILNFRFGFLCCLFVYTSETWRVLRRRLSCSKLVTARIS